MALNKGIQRNTRYLTLSVEFNQIHQANTLMYLECKDCVKYLGVLIVYKLSGKNHVDSIALKISKTIGLLSKLRHFVRHRTLDKFTIPLLLLI